MLNAAAAVLLLTALTAPDAAAQGAAPSESASRGAALVAKQQPAPPPGAGARAPQGRAGRAAGRPGGRGAAQLPDPDAMGPIQVDQFFDTYIVFKAQEFLNLTDSQFLMFGQKLKNLQTIRRRVQRQRHDTLVALRQMVQTPEPLDEAVVTEKLRGLDDLSVQAAPEIKQAYTEIDKLLNPRQRARFRLFEEQMEQKKIELIALARQRQQGRGGQVPQGSQAPQGVVKK